MRQRKEERPTIPVPVEQLKKIVERAEYVALEYDILHPVTPKQSGTRRVTTATNNDDCVDSTDRGWIDVKLECGS